MKEKDINLYLYIENYINNDWVKNILQNELYFMEIDDKALEESIIFIRYLSIIEHKKENYLTFQAYMKSYFDSITSNLAYKKEGVKENFYEKRRILQFYKTNYILTADEENKISKFCDSRNENPLCHSNIKIIKNRNMKKTIEDEARNIIEFVIGVVKSDNRKAEN